MDIRSVELLSGEKFIAVPETILGGSSAANLNWVKVIHLSHERTPGGQSVPGYWIREHRADEPFFVPMTAVKIMKPAKKGKRIDDSA
jgi:hypothetical protein